MSERQPNHHSQEHQPHSSSEHIERLAQAKHAEAEQASHESPTELLEKARHSAAEESKSQEQIKLSETPQKAETASFGEHQTLKDNAYSRVLANTRQSLSAPMRTFSKFVHSPMIDSVSEVGAKTVARPSGLLGGSIAALAGSLVLTYYSRHYGFRYNYLFFFACFVGGFLVGWLLEMLLWLLRPKRRT